MAWIKLHKKFLQWQWAQNAEMVQLFVWLLLSAAYDDGWKNGRWIMRGQVLVSQRKLAEELGMSYKKLRLCLAALLASGEVVTEARRGAQSKTLITICNYDVYQAQDEEDGRNRGAIKGAMNTPFWGAINSEDNTQEVNELAEQPTPQGAQSKPQFGAQKRAQKYKEDIKEFVVVDNSSAREAEIEKLRQSLYASPLKIESAMRATGITDQGELLAMCEEVFADWQFTEDDGVNWKHLRSQLLVKVAAMRQEQRKVSAQPKRKYTPDEFRKGLTEAMMKEAAARLAASKQQANN